MAAKRVKEFQRNVAKASSKDQIKARAKLTRTDADGLHFVSDPPLLVPVAELYSAVDAQAARSRSTKPSAATDGPCRATVGACWSRTDSSTWPAKSSGSEASGPGLGWHCSWGPATPTR